MAWHVLLCSWWVARFEAGVAVLIGMWRSWVGEGAGHVGPHDGASAPVEVQHRELILGSPIHESTYGACLSPAGRCWPSSLMT
jgi:hypothetical protein